MKFANPPKAFCSIAKIIAEIPCGRREEKKSRDSIFLVAGNRNMRQSFLVAASDAEHQPNRTMSATTKTDPLTATQIRNDKVVQSFRVTEDDFEHLARIAQCEPKSVFSIEQAGTVIEVIK